jgi:hypothetical protein
VSEETDSEDLVKGISLTPVVTSLLKPSADLLGVELRDFLKHKIENAKAKRKARNLEEHVRKVRGRLENLPPRQSREHESLERLELFDDWVDGAASVDPEDEVLSSIWENLLFKMAAGDWPTRDLIETMKKLDAQDAKILISLRKGTKLLFKSVEAERYRLERLLSLGLAQKKMSLRLMFPLFVPMAMVTLAWFFFSFYLDKHPYYVDIEFWDRLSLPLLLVLIFAFALRFVLDLDRFSHFGLSALGAKIVSYATHALARDENLDSEASSKTTHDEAANPAPSADG